ncbi:unnamed protein product [Polarella glacialis]|uniref:Uncharacterized protein n=1 Tax=Polarella glacialis TaxID=89957 RepID=A0A813FY84_POLGL|nr:unnamed protein product [Polarella glacialis]
MTSLCVAAVVFVGCVLLCTFLAVCHICALHSSNNNTTCNINNNTYNSNTKTTLILHRTSEHTTTTTTRGVDGSLRVWGAAAGLGPNGPGVPPHICPRWAQAWSRPGGHAPDQVWQDIIFGMLLDLIPLNVSEEPYVPLADEPKPDDLIDIGQLTLQRAARQCEKVCETYREKASSFCECGASLECYRLGDCVPKCGLEAYTWPRAHMQRLTAVAVSPDGLWIATSSFDNTVKIWDAGSFLPEPLAVVKVHQRAVLSLAFSPGRGSQGIVLASGGDDDFIPWFRASALVAAGAEKQVAPFQTFREAAALGKNVPLLAVAFSPDGQWFAAASRGGIGALWDVDTLTKVRELKPVIATTSAALYSAAAGLVFSMDGNWLATRGPSSIKMLPLARVKSSLPPPEDVWVPFTGQEMASVVMTWTSVSGPVGNVPQHFVQQHSNGTVMQISFAPCNVTEGCGTYLPSVRLDVRVPFEFVGVKGYFLEYSVGEKLADDCRGGAKQSGWSEANPARAYWTLLGPGQSAEGNDCVRVGPQDDEGARTSLDTCKQACVWNNLCNLINYRESARNCDLRHCHSATSPMLRPNEDVGAYAYIKYEDIDELSGATADGYLMFGAPDDHGEGGVAYPGCGAGPEVPKSGVWITIPETRIPRTRVLRWQVAQSVNTEVMAISEIFLELLRPVDEEYVIADPAASTAIALAHDRLEMVAATASFNGALGVWDGRGYDIPAGVKNEYKLKSMFSFQVSAPGLEDSDRMRIVDADLVYQCGDPYSSMSTKKVQGPGTGERTLGSGGFSEWTGNAALSAGSYRICYCGSRGVCCNTNSDFATELLSFVVSGAASDHYVVCETSKGSSPTSLIKSCKVQHFRGVGIQEGDMIMIQDGTYCGVTDGPIPGLPNNGVMISRVPQPRDFSGVQLSGTWYQLERENLPKDPGLYDALPLMPATGMMAKLCWCAKLSGCSPDKPEGFASNSGIIALVKVEQEISAACYQKGPCSATIDLTLVTPISAGDVLVVKTGDEPNQRLACGGQIVAEIGPLQDGYSGRMTVSGNIGTFDLGTVEALISGDFRLCWCQASIRTCLTQEEFSFDLGKLHIQPARYVWPACSIQEINFETWRAGAVGCKDTLSASFALCSEYPSR